MPPPPELSFWLRASLRLERSQLRWYGHVTRMPRERTAKKLLCSTPIGRRPIEAVPKLVGEIR